MPDDRVTIDVQAGVAHVRMNRPEKLNALDLAQLEAMVTAGESLKDDKGVRAVVLSGNGRGFCAGLDVSSLRDMASHGTVDQTPVGRRIGDLEGRTTHLGQQACWVWQELPVPVLAAVHGVALGGGCQLALGADIRIAAPDAQFAVLEIRLGLIPDMTGTALLPRLVGLDIAKELTFTGRMVSGEEAARLGLVTRTSETPLDDALAMAHDIAGMNPHAMRHAKRLLNASRHRGYTEQFEDERQTIFTLIGSPNQMEAAIAYFEKRAAVFQE